MKWFRRCLIAVSVIMVAITWFIYSPQRVHAENIFVEDGAGILSQQQKDEIQAINDGFEELEGSPQYVVVTLKNLDDYGSIDDFAVKKFEQLGIGNKDFDNGFLFVISIGDREYKLETGYGVEDVITDSMKDDIVSDGVVDKLKAEDYGDAVMLVSRNVQKIVNDRYADITASKEDVAARNAANARLVRNIIIGFFSLIGLLIFLFGGYFVLRRSQINKIKKGLNKDYGNTFIGQNPRICMTREDYQKCGQSVMAGNLIYRNVLLIDILAKGIQAKNQDIEANKFRDSNPDKVLNYAFYLVFKDGAMQASASSKYDVDVFLHNQYIDPAITEYLAEFGYEYPLNQSFMANYVETTEEKHKRAMVVVQQNKQYVRSHCEAYLSSLAKQPKRAMLFASLMTYSILENQDLSDEHLISKLQLSNADYEDAYNFAKRKSKYIDRHGEADAIRDLDRIDYDTYMLFAILTWTAYASSSSGGGFYGGGGGGFFGGGSSGGGGGSSFGGGSSGGGGFGGSW